MITLNQYDDPNDPYKMLDASQYKVENSPSQMGVDLTGMKNPLDDVTNKLVNPQSVNHMALMGIAQGLLGSDDKQQQQQPILQAMPTRQGGSFANAYKQYLNDYGLLGSK